jgi:hypothetical protein
MHDRGVVNLSDSFDPTSSPAIELHFEAQLLDLIRVSPRTVRFQQLTPALLAFVALPASSMTVFSRLCGVALRAFHPSILTISALLFQQCPT